MPTLRLGLRRNRIGSVFKALRALIGSPHLSGKVGSAVARELPPFEYGPVEKEGRRFYCTFVGKYNSAASNKVVYTSMVCVD
jgi:uncharacterized ParB-like nuclease family protein